MSYKPISNSMVVVHRNTTQSINNNTATAISWSAELRDDDGICNLGGDATKVATFTVAGVWTADAGCQWDAGTTGQRSLSIELYNASNALIWAKYLVMNPLSVSGGTYQSVSDVLRVSSGDYVKVIVYHTQGTALDVGSVNPYTHCTLIYKGV